MTRTHAARRLLELGPLTRPEFAEITGWPKKTVNGVLSALIRVDSVTSTIFQATDRKNGSRAKTKLYALASSPNAEKCGHLNEPMQQQPTSDTGSNCRGSDYLRQRSESA